MEAAKSVVCQTHSLWDVKQCVFLVIKITKDDFFAITDAFTSVSVRVEGRKQLGWGESETQLQSYGYNLAQGPFPAGRL